MPDPQPLTAPAYDPHSGGENSPENSRLEKIITAGERVFKKFGIVRPGRGRPRNDGQPKKSDLVAEIPGGDGLPAGNASVAGLPPVPAGLDMLRVKAFAAGCTGLLKGAVALVKKWVKGQASEAKIDPAFTEKTLADCQPSPADFQEWQEAMEVCAAQYRWDFEHMPAVNLGVKTVGIFAPFVALAGEFKKEIARQRAKDGAAQPPKNQ